MVNYHNNKHFYQYTKYPRKFKRTYWGNFTVTNNWFNFNEIVENRNTFISKYNIKKRMDYCYCPKYIRLEFTNLKYGDHDEIYLTNDKDYILITSPYRSTNNDEFTNINNGWYPIEKLYSSSATTFMKVITMMKKI